MFKTNHFVIFGLSSFLPIILISTMSDNQPIVPSEQTVGLDIVDSKIYSISNDNVITLDIEEPKKYKVNDYMTSKDLKAVLLEAGFRGKRLKEAFTIVMKESNGRPKAHNKNDSTGDNSYGLFQINMIGSLGPARLEQYNLSSNKELFDPLVNAKIAFHMSNGGKNWSAWGF